MRSSQIKLGRNDPCPCGSGNKYKKCCLSAEKLPLNPVEQEKSQQRLVGRVKQDMGDKFILLSGEAEIKMSAVILDLTEELLNFAQTKSQYQKAITVV